VNGAGVDEQRHPEAGEATERTSVSRAQQCGLRDVSANLICGNGIIQDRSQPMFQRLILSEAPRRAHHLRADPRVQLASFAAARKIDRWFARVHDGVPTHLPIKLAYPAEGCRGLTTVSSSKPPKSLIMPFVRGTSVFASNC
jgi:hypothetical protein